MHDVITAIRSALAATDVVVRAVPANGWDRPTPCDLWTVRDVTNHLVGGLRIFTGELNGVPASAAHESDWLGDDPVAAYADAAADDATAWARTDALVGTVTIGLGTMPRPMAAVIHLTEVVVHGLDIATAINRHDLADVDAAAALLETMRQMGGVDPYRVPGVFGQAIAVSPHEPAHVQLLAYLGRAVACDSRDHVA